MSLRRPQAAVQQTCVCVTVLQRLSLWILVNLPETWHHSDGTPRECCCACSKVCQKAHWENSHKLQCKPGKKSVSGSQAC